jgi:hypothetical protein
MSNASNDQPTAGPSLPEKPEFDKEINLRTRELDLKEREVVAKEVELRRSRWMNPTVFGLFAAAIGIFGNAYLANFNNIGSQKIEHLKLQDNLILEATKSGPGGPEAACKNLVFLVRAGLLDDPKGTIINCVKTPKDSLYIPSAAAAPQAISQTGSITQWNDADGRGLLLGGETHSVYISVGASDCSQKLLVALHGKDIPPSPSVRVSYNLEFREGSMVAINVDLLN